MFNDNVFHAPVNHNIISQMVAEFRSYENKINSLATVVQEADFSIFHYFLQGNINKDNKQSISLNPDVLFNTEGAFNQLKSDFWRKTMDLTQVWKIMPEIRRQEWKNQIANNSTPEFTEDNVRATMLSLFSSRKIFIAEKADGVFNNLSAEHVTNCPEGFGKRFIMQGLDSMGFVNCSKSASIDDLRSIISHFLNRGDYVQGATHSILNYCYQHKIGEWVNIDGNSIRMKVFKKGTVHFEIHEDIAYRLNDLLAELYPLAIPEKNRKPKKQNNKNYVVNTLALPYKVIDYLNSMNTPPLIKRSLNYWTDNPNSLRFSDFNINWKDPEVKQAVHILESIGGIKKQINNAIWFEFEYDVKPTIQEIVISGSVPDNKSHQYYPTLEPLANEAVEICGIEDSDDCLEPSAGQGGILQFMPKDKTVAVEISKVFSQILKDKGYNVVNNDFLSFAKHTDKRFDKIVMNPPFSEGRAALHTKTAFSLLKEKGILTAILPATFKNVILIENKKHEWSDIKEDCFIGTKVSVVIVKIYN